MPSKIPEGTYFGKELKERIYFDDNSISDLWHDLKELWKNNYGDTSHPNLYYSLFRAWNFDVKSGDFAWLKARGIGLNIVFFVLGFYASFILMTKIFSRENLFVPLFLAFAFLNSASVTNTIFIRPYALQEMLLIVFVLNCFVFFKLDFRSAKEAFSKHKLFFIWFIFATALLCLSHYFSLFFIAFAFIFLAFISRKNIFPLSLVALGSFAITQILYLGYFSSPFHDHHAKESAPKLLLDNFWQNLASSFKAGVEILQTHFCNAYGFVIVCVACGIALFLARKHIRFKMQKLHIWTNLRAFFIFVKPLLKNALKPYKKIFIALSAFMIFAYIVAFILIDIAKDSTQNAQIRLDSLTPIMTDSGAFAYTGKIFYTNKILHARSKTASNLILESIAWDNALDSSKITITQIKNRYIDFSSTQNLRAILGDEANKTLGVLSYRVDFIPLLNVVWRYYVALLGVSFLITFYVQYAKIAWSKDFSSDLVCESNFECESSIKPKNATFLFGIFVVAIAWFCFVFFVAPYKELRYVMPVFAFLYFGVILVLNALKKPILQGVFGVCFVASLFINYNVKYLYKEPFIFVQNPHIPVIVHLPTFSWQQGAFVFAFDDTQRYIIEPDFTRLKEKMRGLEAFYFIGEKPFDTPLGYTQSTMQNDWYGYFYLFKKSEK